MFSEAELSNAGKEHQNKSMEFGFSEETTSASSINNGKTDNARHQSIIIKIYFILKKRI